MPYRSIYFLIILFFTLLSCKENVVNKTPIILDDSSFIVTESDTQFLSNITEDIAPVGKKVKSSATQISQMMAQVDSMNASKKLEQDAVEKVEVNIKGFEIHFEECNVTFENVEAHALNNSQNERATHSVSYLLDAGSLLDTKLEISQLEDCRVEQRLFVKLAIVNKDQTIQLNELGKNITDWQILAGKNNRFVSVSNNSLIYDQADGNKIRTALEKALKQKRKDKDEIKEWMTIVAKVNKPTDAPCKLIAVSSQWRIVGKKAGKNIRKLIQFDIP